MSRKVVLIIFNNVSFLIYTNRRFFSEWKLGALEWFSTKNISSKSKKGISEFVFGAALPHANDTGILMVGTGLVCITIAVGVGYHQYVNYKSSQTIINRLMDQESEIRSVYEHRIESVESLLEVVRSTDEQLNGFRQIRDAVGHEFRIMTPCHPAHHQVNRWAAIRSQKCWLVGLSSW